jgi:CHAT domain-containing protein
LERSLEFQDSRAAVNPRIYQTTLLNLCETLFWMGSLKEADEGYRRLSKMLLDEIMHNFTYLSDKEKISFYRNNHSIIEFYKYFVFEVSGALRGEDNTGRYVNKHALADLFDVLLATKGLILHPGYRLRNTILQSSSPELRQSYERWEYSKNRYATLARTETPDRNELSTLLREIEDTEKWLRFNSSEFRRGFVMEHYGWDDIRKNLKPGEAAIEMVRLADGLVYGALIVTRDTKDGPVVALAKSTRTRHLDTQYYRQYVNSISYRLQDTISFDTYWSPILEKIQEIESKDAPIKRIYFSPDGVYNRINLGTLWNPTSKRFLVDEMEIVRVTNLKEVIAHNRASSRVRQAVLLGRPAYYSGESSTQDLSDLPATELEIDAINKLLVSKKWRTLVLKQMDAQEYRVKSVSNPVVLHMATHGFSLNGNEGESYLDNLLNSGVVLAGAGDKTALNDEDGVLTAYEMMNMMLDSTQLVVLSACETGLGEYHNGEGIYGLQAALRSAGVRFVVMSLWKVDDNATQQLMTNFYKAWINSPSDPRAAFRKAQQELRKSFPDPYFWGAFVMTGN